MPRVSQYLMVLAWMSPVSALTSQATGATTAQDREAVEMAAATYMRAHLGKGTIALDLARAVHTREVPVRSPAQAQRLAGALNARLGDYKSGVVCSPKDHSMCHMTGADMLVSIDPPALQGDTALVWVHTTFAIDSESFGVRSVGDQLIVVRQGAVWRVVGIRRENST